MCSQHEHEEREIKGEDAAGDYTERCKESQVPQASAELRSQKRNLLIFQQLPRHDSFTHLWTPEEQHRHACCPN